MLNLFIYNPLRPKTLVISPFTTYYNYNKCNKSNKTNNVQNKYNTLFKEFNYCNQNRYKTIKKLKLFNLVKTTLVPIEPLVLPVANKKNSYKQALVPYTYQQKLVFGNKKLKSLPGNSGSPKPEKSEEELPASQEDLEAMARFLESLYEGASPSASDNSSFESDFEEEELPASAEELEAMARLLESLGDYVSSSESDSSESDSSEPDVIPYVPFISTSEKELRSLETALYDKDKGVQAFHKANEFSDAYVDNFLAESCRVTVDHRIFDTNVSAYKRASNASEIINETHEFATGPSFNADDVIPYTGKGFFNGIMERLGYIHAETQKTQHIAETHQLTIEHAKALRVAYSDGVEAGLALAVDNAVAANEAWTVAVNISLVNIFLLVLVTLAFDYALSVLHYYYFSKYRN